MTGKLTSHDRVQRIALAECVCDLAETMRMLADLVAVMADRIEAIEKQPEKKASDAVAEADAVNLVEVDATLELELPEGADAAAHAKRLIDAIQAVALAEEYCVAWEAISLAIQPLTTCQRNG